MTRAHRPEHTLKDVIVVNARRFFGRLSLLTAGVHATSAARRQGLVTSFLALSLTLIGGAVHAQENRDLTSLSVDDLMNVEVTSVSRKGQKLAAAVFVITQDDIYTPFFSGVFWDVQDTLLEDVDRIEVTRGPGGTLWGASSG